MGKDSAKNTTNYPIPCIKAILSVHRRFKKVTGTISINPSKDALKKMLYHAYRDLAKK